MKNWTKVKLIEPCKKCIHYYIGNHTIKKGYNPLPYCHRYEDIGESCNPITFECFEKFKQIKNKGAIK